MRGGQLPRPFCMIRHRGRTCKQEFFLLHWICRQPGEHFLAAAEDGERKERKIENNHNSKERQKEVQRLTLVVLGIMTAVIIGYTAYGLATDKMNMLLFGLLLGGFVILYLVMSDIVEPYRLGLLRELTQEKRSAFLKILLMDLIGGGALIYWIAGLGSETGSDILIPFLIYFLTAQLKRKYRAEFDGTAAEEADGGEEE